MSSINLKITEEIYYAVLLSNKHYLHVLQQSSVNSLVSLMINSFNTLRGTNQCM
jgi:hypothetical protein